MQITDVIYMDSPAFSQPKTKDKTLRNVGSSSREIRLLYNGGKKCSWSLRGGSSDPSTLYPRDNCGSQNKAT